MNASRGAFFKLSPVPVQEKNEALHTAVAEMRTRGKAGCGFEAPGELFRRFPDSAFVYDLPAEISEFFASGTPVARTLFTAHRGLCSANADHQFRLWWEVDAAALGPGKQWMRSNNGSPYSPFYHPSLWAVLAEEGRWTSLTAYPSGALTSADLYGLPGAGYGKRTSHMYAYPLPADHAFTVEGQALFPAGESDEWALLTVANSRLYATVVNRFTAQHKYHGYLNAMYFPAVALSDVGDLPHGIVYLLRELDALNEISPIFRSCGAHPFRPRPGGMDVAAAVDLANASRRSIDSIVEERAGVAVAVQDATPSQVDYVESFYNEPLTAGPALWAGNLLMWCVGVAFGRWDVRMARDGSLIPALQGPFERLPRVAPGGLVGPDGLPATAECIASEAWLRARPSVITLPEPGSWAGPDHVTAAEYPVPVAWDGILVDDEGHPRDVVAAVRQVLRCVYGERAGAVEEEALALLRGEGRTPRTLREWFRTQKAAALGKSFFEFHLQRYSKSRRKAPIYWRLASLSKGASEYAVWLYYPRLTDDTLWSVLNDCLLPRQRLQERRLQELRAEREQAGADARRLEREIEGAVQLLEELAWMEGEVRAVAERGYAPDLDDGVLLNAAPLHRVIAWKEPEAAWKKLEAGEYDWAKVAMKLWPERVRQACRKDRSLAIAHGLEALYGTEAG